MGQIFNVPNVAFAPGAARHVLEIVAGADHSVKLRRVWMTSGDTAGATVVRVNINRITATGTGTAATAEPAIEGGVAFTGTCKVNDTVAPTTGNIQRSEQWNILTKYDERWDSEEAMVAQVGHGFSVQLLDNPAATITVGAEFELG